jgi:hypothetical protein
MVAGESERFRLGTDRSTTMTPIRRLANDADFQNAYRAASSFGAAILRSGATMTEADKQDLVADLQSGDAARAGAALAALGATERAIQEQRRLLRRLVERYDVPLDASLAGILGDAAVAAKWSYDEEHGGGPAPDPLDELEDELGLPGDTGTSGGTGGGTDTDDDNSGCYDLCAAQAAALAASALATYIAALAGCAAGGPFALLCWAVASAGYAVSLYELDAVVDRCVANCGG